jgi:hypothetical protein
MRHTGTRKLENNTNDYHVGYPMDTKNSSSWICLLSPLNFNRKNPCGFIAKYGTLKKTKVDDIQATYINIYNKQTGHQSLVNRLLRRSIMWEI